MKIIFMGTPEFSVEILKALMKNYEVVLVITQPDAYNYRKKEYIPTPVKKYALENSLKVMQPEEIKEVEKQILKIDVDLIVSAAYGQFVSQKIVNHPKHRAINVHGSILPKYRGGAPIQRAIMNGEKETGVSIIYMEKKMDSGDILKISKIPILDEDNQETIFNKLSILGSKVVVEVIEELKQGTAKRVPQIEAEATFAYNLKKEDELIDFSKTALEVFNQIRGLNPNPGAYFKMDKQNIKVFNSEVVNMFTNKESSIIIDITKKSFIVSCGNNTAIAITEIQLPGKNRIKVSDFLNGRGREIVQINKEINK